MIKRKMEHTKQKSDCYKLLGLFIGVVAVMAFFIIWGLTKKNITYYLPRRALKMGTIAIVSYCIGYSTVGFQTITNNRILTPSVMGLDSLYLFIQTVIVFFFGSRQLSMMTGYTNFLLSVVIMVGSSWLLFLVLFRGENKNLYFLVLTGMIFGGLFQGMATFMQVLLDPNEFLVLQGKMFASFNNINEPLFYICLVLVLLTMLITRRDLHQLDVIALGPDHAINLGVSYHKMVIKMLMVTAVLISIATALVGPITFLGILVVSIARNVIKTYRHSYQITASVLIGCFALSFGTLMLERVFKFNTTLSVIINFIGGIYFIYLIMKEAKQ